MGDQRLACTALAGVAASIASETNKHPLTPLAIGKTESHFNKLMDLANKHDIKGLNAMFWQSPSTLLVAKTAAASGPVVLTPDLSKLKVVRLTPDIAEYYAPMTITVSYAGQDATLSRP